jgi:glycine/D-amino acid oxidase-like deaminating enzyme/nitrite reductase/ring-hydroxylating ferredoxin subunit
MAEPATRGGEHKPSLWLAGAGGRRYPPLDGELTVDVAVVGAGITGLTAALLLARGGRRVALLEAARVASGTSGGTSAHVTEVTDHGYDDLVDKHGEAAVAAYATASRQALDWIAAAVAELAIDCGWREVPAFHYAEAAADLPDLEAEADTARRLGLRASFTREVPLPYRAAGAVRFDGQAQFHPVRYLDALAAALVRAGGAVHEGTRVVDWEERGSRVAVRCAGEGRVLADDLVLATHTPLGRTPVQAELAACRSYLLGVRLAGAPPRGLFWDSDSPYHYLRDAADGEGDLLLVGGADHPTGRESDTTGRYEELERWTRERLPVSEVAYRWSSQYYDPADGLPYVGRRPLDQRVWIATGYAGVGLAGGTLAALLLHDLLRGRDHPLAAACDPGRLQPLAAGPRIAALNATIAARWLADRVRPAAAEALATVARGEGMIVDLDGRQRAVYRDPQGGLHVLSPVCTHLGCLVDWNGAERTWDCPCHGGRYAPTGEVLTGPPMRGLTPEPLDNGD